EDAAREHGDDRRSDWSKEIRPLVRATAGTRRSEGVGERHRPLHRAHPIAVAEDRAPATTASTRASAVAPAATSTTTTASAARRGGRRRLRRGLRARGGLRLLQQGRVLLGAALTLEVGA